MMIRQSQIRVAVLLSLALLSLGCSVAEQKRQLYRQSQIIAPLKIPADLQQPQGEDMLPVFQVETFEPIDITPPVNLPEELLATPQGADKAE